MLQMIVLVSSLTDSRASALAPAVPALSSHHSFNAEAHPQIDGKVHPIVADGASLKEGGEASDEVVILGEGLLEVGVGSEKGAELSRKRERAFHRGGALGGDQDIMMLKL
jgi:hypothetical protein